MPMFPRLAMGCAGVGGGLAISESQQIQTGFVGNPGGLNGAPVTAAELEKDGFQRRGRVCRLLPAKHRRHVMRCKSHSPQCSNGVQNVPATYLLGAFHALLHMRRVVGASRSLCVYVKYVCRQACVYMLCFHVCRLSASCVCMSCLYVHTSEDRDVRNHICTVCMYL
jgi:hypothetical protein